MSCKIVASDMNESERELGSSDSFCVVKGVGSVQPNNDFDGNSCMITKIKRTWYR